MQQPGPRVALVTHRRMCHDRGTGATRQAAGTRGRRQSDDAHAPSRSQTGAHAAPGGGAGCRLGAVGNRGSTCAGAGRRARRVAPLRGRRQRPQVLGAEPDLEGKRPTASRGLALPIARPRVPGRSDPAPVAQRGHPVDGQRPALQHHGPRHHLRAGSGHRRGPLGVRPRELRAGASEQRRVPAARHGLLDRRHGGAAADRHRRRLPAVARRAHRPARPRVRGQRQGRPDHRYPGRRAQHQLLRAAAPGRRRHRRRRQLDRRLLAHAAHAAGGRAGVRRAHGPQAVDVPHHPARVRGGLRNLAERIGRVHGQRQRLGRHGVRPRARLRVHGHLHADQQLLRRRAARRQPVRREHRLRGGADRRARLALPGHSPRHLGLRLRGHAGARRHHRRRAHHQGHHAGEQAGVHLRVRPRDRRAGLAHRGAAGAALHRARRGGGGHAALPHPAAGVRPAGYDRGQPDRPDAGPAAPRAREAAAVRLRAALHAADRARHADAAGPDRRGELGRRRLRRGHRHPVRAVAHVAVHRPAHPTRRAAAGHPAPGRRRHDRRGHSALQAALGAIDGHRHEPGRGPVDQPDRQRSPRPSRCCATSICPRSATTSTARASW